MNDPKQSNHFWIGNAMLGVSLVMLIFLGQIWDALGVWAMALWMALAGFGMYFVTKDKGPGSNMPD